MYQLPFEYDEKATAPLFIQYLDKVLPDKQAQAVLAEYVGHLFIRNGVGMKLEKCLILFGKGANGKSVFFEVLKALLGSENVCTYSVSELTDKTGYYRAEIANKLVNYASELGKEMNTDLFKKLSSGEPFTARSPFVKPFEVSNYAKMIFNANELPKDVEQTDAYFRRFIIIPFNVTIPEAEQDKELHIKIINAELAGVFNWMLDGLKRLLGQRKFTECVAIKQQLLEYKIESDSVQTFLNENDYEKSISEKKLLKELLKEYKEFCKEEGYISLGKRIFSEQLRSKEFEIRRAGEGRFVYIQKKK